MLNDNEYIKESLEMGLVLTRFMLDHAIILEILLLDENIYYSSLYQAEKEEYEKMLNLLLDLADGKVSKGFLQSNTLATEFSNYLMHKTEETFKIDIDSNIINKALQLKSGNVITSKELVDTINKINKKILNMLENSKENLLILDKAINDSKISIDLDYINHFLEETEIFIYTLENLINRFIISPTTAYSHTFHSTNAMKEHALFIKNIKEIDNNLKNDLDNFSEEYNKLLQDFDNNINPSTMTELLDKSLFITKEHKNLINKLLIDSIEKDHLKDIIPLKLDHILREANHSIAKLEFFNRNQFRV